MVPKAAQKRSDLGFEARLIDRKVERAGIRSVSASAGARRYSRNMRAFSVLLLASVFFTLSAQDVKPKDVRDVAKGGPGSIPTLQGYLKGHPPDVRAEAVKQLTSVGTAASLDPLIVATQDDDPQIQILATDGLVNFYSPGYVKTGITGSLQKVGTSIKGKFTDTNDLMIDGYVVVRPEVIDAIAKMVTSGVNADVRANAAHAEGILRGSPHSPCCSRQSTRKIPT